MSRTRLIAIIVIVAITFPAAMMLANQFSSGELIQIDLTLKLKSTSDDLEYVAAYHWAGDEIESSVSSNNVKWKTKTALASVRSSGQLTEAVRSHFSQIEIENDLFDISTDGTWTLNMRKRLCSGVTMNLAVDGDDTRVESITPSLNVELMPQGLAAALQNIGINSVSVIVTLSVHIVDRVVEQFFENCFQVVKSYADLAKELIDIQIGYLYAS